MKQKWPLFAGILLLILGIVLRKAFDINTGGLVLIITGVLFKTYYIINKIVIGEYKPGFEMFFLAAGLTIFFLRNYLHLQINAVPAGAFMGIGISLKIIFIVLSAFPGVGDCKYRKVSLLNRNHCVFSNLTTGLRICFGFLSINLNPMRPKCTRSPCSSFCPPSGTGR